MIAAALVLSGAQLQVQAVKPDGKGCPYVLVTTAGESIGSLDLPKHDGKPVKFRSCVNGTLTMVSSAEVDWGATEKRNGTGPVPTLTPTPVRQALSGIANKMQVRDVEGLVKQNENSGKMRTASGKEIELQGKNFFGKESVAAHLELGAFLANTSTCPASRAVAFGVARNVSRVKLRDLKAYVVVAGASTGGQILAMDPSNLMPGERVNVRIYLPCDFATQGGPSETGDTSVVVVLPDISGRAEDPGKP